MEHTSSDRVRVDKWLWAARFYKTRSLAAKAVEGGQAKVNGDRAKPSRELKVGDRLDITLPDGLRTVIVQSLSDKRGPATVARLLYEETEESRLERERRISDKVAKTDPSADIVGRPTKQARRELENLRKRLLG